MGEPQQVVIFALEIIHRVHLADGPSDAVAARKAKTPSLFNRRFRPSQVELRSTIQVRPVILNARCRRLTIWTASSRLGTAGGARAGLWCPASAMTVRISGKWSRATEQQGSRLSVGDVGGSTLHASSSRRVSTECWRFRPFRACAHRIRECRRVLWSLPTDRP